MAITLYRDPINHTLVGEGGTYSERGGQVGQEIEGGSEGGGSFKALDPGSYTIADGPAAPSGANRGNAYLTMGPNGTPQYRGIQNGSEGFYSGNTFNPVQTSEAKGSFGPANIGSFLIPAAATAIGLGAAGFGPLAGADTIAGTGVPAVQAGLDPTGISAGDIARGGVGNFTAGNLTGAGAAAIGLDPTGISAADIARGGVGNFTPANLGITTPAGLPGVTPSSGAPAGASPSAPAAPAAPGGAPGGAAAPGASGGLPGASGGAAGGAAAGGSFVDNLIKQMKDSALGLGLITASSLAGATAGKGQAGSAPNVGQIEQQLAGLSGDAQGVAKQLLGQYTSGALSPGQQASLDQVTQNTKNQLRQYFASIGQSNSTAAAQAEAQVDQAALGMKQQILDNALNQGLSAIGIASGPLSQVAQYQLGQDAQLKQAFGNFAGAIGNLFGRQSGGTGTPTQTTSNTGSPTTVSSAQATAPTSIGG